MPSPMSATDNEVQGLTNEEIEILYDIVRHAQTLPDPPFRALFKAYDHIRQQRHIADDGSRCFTFILRMQEDTREGEGLVDRFQRVLSELGIQVELDPEGEGVEVTTSLANRELPNGQNETRNSVGRILSRRGSFDSFFEGTVDKLSGNAGGQVVTSRSRRGSVVSDVADQRQKRRTRSDSRAQEPLAGQLPLRGTVNGFGNQRATSHNLALRPRRSGSVSSHGSLRIHRNGQMETQQFADYGADESDHTDSYDRSHIQIPGVNAPFPGEEGDDERQYAAPESSFRPSDTQIVRDAEIFDHQRIFGLARACIHRWRDQTGARIEQSEYMNARAVAFDRNILLRASLDSWRAALQTKRQAVETDHFFHRLEDRAAKARNLFLLTKAFTHWAKSAEDEVQRTSTARRHILRTRYFNAWRDITAVNELKIQNFVLGNFLYKWRARTAAVREQSDLALGLYEHNLVYKLYWQWFWKFGDRRAPMLHNNRLKKDTIIKWAEIVRILREREAWAAERCDHEIARRALASLRAKAASARKAREQADDFRDSARLSAGFYALRKQVKLAPLYDQAKTRVDNRVVQSALQMWHRTTQLSRQARNVDRMRITRNAFTTWNDALRTKTFKEQVDERVQLECLYKWALASRVSLFNRVHEHHLKQSLFATWITKAQSRKVALENAERRFAQFKRRQLLRSHLQKLENAMAHRRDQELLARSIIESKLKKVFFSKLLEKHEHYQQLNGWAERANYYVTAKHSIKRWQQATKYAHRNRRRDTYAQMRRKVKISLVRRTFMTWREKSNHIAAQQLQVDEMVGNRVLRISTHILVKWHDLTTTLQAHEEQAVRQDNTRLLARSLTAWTEKSRHLLNLADQAVALRQESTEIAASTCFKKLGWRLFNLQRQEKTAVALYERNFEKHRRAMLRFWWEQASERLAQRPVSPTPSSRPRGPRSRQDDDVYDDDHNDHDKDNGGSGDEDNISNDDYGEDILNDAGDETRRLESWTAFDENGLGLSNTNLDLSFNVVSPYRRHPPTHSSTQPTPRSAPRRTFTTQPPSALRSAMRPPPIPELQDEDGEPGFWTSTPMPPPSKAGYLKTPSKRSVARAKRPGLLASPEKRDRVGLGDASARREGEGFIARGAASAPPGMQYKSGFGAAGANAGVTSFERRLREGGFGRGSKGKGKERARVGFEGLG